MHLHIHIRCLVVIAAGQETASFFKLPAPYSIFLLTTKTGLIRELAHLVNILFLFNSK